MPRPAERRSGSGIAGLSWLMLSSPENASHAPAKPTRNVVGVDVVGDKVLEINVFAPGGVHNINELYDIDVGGAVVDDLERRVRQRRDAA